jgi:hypothetical protein
MLKDNSYPFLHWFSTLIIGPIIFILICTVNEKSIPADSIEIFFLFLTFGFIFSLPAVTVNLLIFLFLKGKQLPPIIIKVILNLTAITLLLITSYVIGRYLMRAINQDYILAILISSLFFRIRKKTGPSTSAL